MNLNNKFGNCCNCPGLMEDGRIYTSYVPRKDLNYSLMAEVQAGNNNQYKDILQARAGDILSAVKTTLETNYRCASNAKGDQMNTFYQVTDINKFFDDQFNNTLNTPTKLTNQW